jgi:hypothetical protein
MTDKGGCSHIELVSQTRSLEAHLLAFEKLMDERDKRYNQRAIAQDEAVKSALATSKEAVTKAENATEKRFESVNEFRKTLSDQAGNFLSRVEYGSNHKGLEEKIAAIGDRIARMETESSTKAKGVTLIGSLIVGVIMTISYAVGIVIAFSKH